MNEHVKPEKSFVQNDKDVPIPMVGADKEANELSLWVVGLYRSVKEYGELPYQYETLSGLQCFEKDEKWINRLVTELQTNGKTGVVFRRKEEKGKGKKKRKRKIAKKIKEMVFAFKLYYGPFPRNVLDEFSQFMGAVRGSDTQGMTMGSMWSFSEDQPHKEYIRNVLIEEEAFTELLVYGKEGKTLYSGIEEVLKEDPTAVEALKGDPTAVEELKGDPAAVEESKEDPGAVEELKEDPAAVEESKEDPAAVEELKGDPGGEGIGLDGSWGAMEELLELISEEDKKREELEGKEE